MEEVQEKSPKKVDPFAKEKKSYDNRLWYESNKDKKRALNQAYYAANREKVKRRVKDNKIKRRVREDVGEHERKMKLISRLTV